MIVTTPLTMIKLKPDIADVSLWAHEQKLVRRGGDLGYALHALLAASFGLYAPKPFRLHETRRSTVLYGYATADKDTLTEHAAAFADPDVVNALSLASLEVKEMPSVWSAGRRLGFEVRVRPIVRQDKAGDRGKARERDAFLAACDQAGEGVKMARANVYGDWLANQFQHTGARLVDSKLKAFRRSQVARRDQRRNLKRFEGPDATMKGTIEITDGDAFHALLKRGIGRHRSFGYGMLLLQPADRGNE